MAGDLIPPPSPARRTDPGAEAQATAQLEGAVQLKAEAETEAEPAEPSPFRNRFGFVFGALAGIGACVAILAGVLLVWDDGGGGPELAADWSEWQPETTRMLDGAVDIATHIEFQYKRDDGGALVTVGASTPEAQELGIAVTPGGGEPVILEGDGLIYALVGSEDGLLPRPPSEKRDRLLQREALELALYSFRYLEDVTMVAVLLPRTVPEQVAAGEEQPETEDRRAVLFRPGDLLPQLRTPLRETLPTAPPTPEKLTDEEATRIGRLVSRNLFEFTTRPLGTGGDYLVLTEPTTE